ncbi:MAG: JAB domain-containing protein [Sphingomicrobium sp.]
MRTAPFALLHPVEARAGRSLPGGRASTRRPALLAGFDQSRQFFAECFRAIDPARETLFVAFLDAAARCIQLSRHDGDAAGVEWPLRAILLEAARTNCAGLIVAHNHPSGDSSPSASDRSATRRLATAAEAIDVALVDHLLFAAEDCCSFRRMGLL